MNWALLWFVMRWHTSSFLFPIPKHTWECLNYWWIQLFTDTEGMRNYSSFLLCRVKSPKGRHGSITYTEAWITTRDQPWFHGSECFCFKFWISNQRQMYTGDVCWLQLITKKVTTAGSSEWGSIILNINVLYNCILLSHWCSCPMTFYMNYDNLVPIYTCPVLLFLVGLSSFILIIV